MILEANQRGGAKRMADHLLNVEDNEHVDVHEISGFISDNIHGALHEIYAMSRATKCTQFMFSVSLNPPENEIVPVEYFERAMADIEKQCGLSGQPRVVVFHEKEGRRHAHCIWSRIKADELKAINLPFYKQKLKTISRDMYLQYGWNLPKGFIDHQYRDPLNFTREEWQQAKRAGEDAKLLKALFKQAWQTSDNKTTFEHALKDYGFWLAKGDRRGFVAVDYKGNTYSLSRWLDVRTKELKQRLGEPENYSSVQDTKATISHVMTDTLKGHIQLAHQQAKAEYAPLLGAVQAMKENQQNQRHALKQEHAERWKQEEQARVQRLPRGLKGIWHRLTGKYAKVRNLNEHETAINQTRDRREKQEMITRQLNERQRLKAKVQEFRQDYNNTMLELRRDIAHYAQMGQLPENRLQTLMQDYNKGNPDFTPEM